jgi:antirestriction protein ArdC
MTSPRWLTVAQAAADLDVSTHTIWRWLRNAHPDQVPRQKIRLEDSRGRRTKQLVVEIGALMVYEKTLR